MLLRPTRICIVCDVTLNSVSRQLRNSSLLQSRVFSRSRFTTSAHGHYQQNWQEKCTLVRKHADIAGHESYSILDRLPVRFTTTGLINAVISMLSFRCVLSGLLANSENDYFNISSVASYLPRAPWFAARLKTSLMIYY